MATTQMARLTGEHGPIDEVALRTTVAGVLDRWPSAGLAVAVVRDGSPVWFHGHGVAEVATGKPVTEDTVFRVGRTTT
jgi:CubicO group peptidase (beta-lactamase class C family)